MSHGCPLNTGFTTAIRRSSTVIPYVNIEIKRKTGGIISYYELCFIDFIVIIGSDKPHDWSKLTLYICFTPV